MGCKLFFIFLEKIYVNKNYTCYTQNGLGICNKTTYINKLAFIKKT